jgi:hypothetical protein
MTDELAARLARAIKAASGDDVRCDGLVDYEADVYARACLAEIEAAGMVIAPRDAPPRVAADIDAAGGLPGGCDADYSV